jgi:SAM-dependent methyltransferase
MIDQASLESIFRLKHGDPETTGWSPRRRYRFGYFTPDDVYEAAVDGLVGPGCAWLDVGCGRDLFPSNRPLSRRLADRCGVLVGVDPDGTIEENEFVHVAFRGTLEDYRPDREFDLVTLRMVAEHIERPESAVDTLARLVRPGGKVVVYTVARLAPVSIASRMIPFRFHHAIKHSLWKTEDKDTFPVVYRMNTRRRLARLFGVRGFRECEFRYLADCRVFGGHRALGLLELLLWRGFQAVGIRYPESCLLGVYERS